MQQGIKADEVGRGLESLRHQMADPSCSFRWDVGEPQKALELQESQAKRPCFIRTSDEVSVMGFEIGFGAHKVCLCGLENASQRLWVPARCRVPIISMLWLTRPPRGCCNENAF